jgi:hypothetical protein
MMLPVNTESSLNRQPNLMIVLFRPKVASLT